MRMKPGVVAYFERVGSDDDRRVLEPNAELDQLGHHTDFRLTFCGVSFKVLNQSLF